MKTMSIFLNADLNSKETEDGYEIPSFAVVRAKTSDDEEIRDLDLLIRIKHRNLFLKTLYEMIDERGLKDSEVYKAAMIERRYFSKIRRNRIPKKHTVLALGLALRLDLTQMNELLHSAGYSLTDTRREDIIIRWCIRQKIYNVLEVNEILLNHNAPLLR